MACAAAAARHIQGDPLMMVKILEIANQSNCWVPAPSRFSASFESESESVACNFATGRRCPVLT
eukprot:3371279-Rhodomonas_salina.1